MSQLIKEFTIALAVCWLAFAALSGCAVDQQEVFKMITQSKPKVIAPKVIRMPASNVSHVGAV